MNIPKTFLTEAYEVDTKSILKILTQSESGNTSDQQLNALAAWAVANRRQSKITNINISSIKNSAGNLVKQKLNDQYNSLGSLLNTLDTITKKESKYGKNKELADQIQKVTLDILKDLKAKEDGKQAKEEPEEFDLYEGMDWTAEKSKRLTAARKTGEAISSVLDKFYDDYYSVEYAGKTKSSNGDPDIIAKLKSLDKILIPEFNALGYSPEVNPFAQFLKLLIKHERDDIFKKLNTNNYGAIHNSFINKHVTGNMLGNYNENNILLCSDLYNYKGLDIVNYLLLQKQSLDAAERNNKYSDDKKLIAKMFIQQQALDKDYAENIRKLFDEPVTIKIISPSDSAAKLKSELEVQELYRHLFKAIPKKRGDAKEIAAKAIEKKIGLSMIQRIIDQNAFEDDYAATVQKMEKWLSSKGYQRNNKSIEASKEILSGYILTTKIENSIIAEIYDHFTKQTKKEKSDT